VKNHSILITKQLTDDQLETAKHYGWKPVVIPALRSRALSLPAYENPWKSQWWMVTSARAIPAFLHYNHLHPTDNIACTSPTVREKLIHAGITPVIAAENAETLASRISLKNPKGVLHLCARHSREEAGLIFSENKISYRQIPVYETIPEQLQVEWQNFDGWLLLSPRSLEAFSTAPPPKDLAVGAIGNTTAKALETAGFTRIFVASKPDTDTLIQEFNDYLRH
jgi:uroporphyrinogen-III synthase